MMVMNDLSVDSLENCMQGSLANPVNLVMLHWPLKALTYIVTNNWEQVPDKEAFYESLFDMYKTKIEIIHREKVFF